jgi:hypothetical protein
MMRAQRQIVTLLKVLQEAFAVLFSFVIIHKAFEEEEYKIQSPKMIHNNSLIISVFNCSLRHITRGSDIVAR